MSVFPFTGQSRLVRNPHSNWNPTNIFRLVPNIHHYSRPEVQESLNAYFVADIARKLMLLDEDSLKEEILWTAEALDFLLRLSSDDIDTLLQVRR